MATADAAGSTVILANDPDADRLAVAEKQSRFVAAPIDGARGAVDGAGWLRLAGDQIRVWNMDFTVLWGLGRPSLD